MYRRVVNVLFLCMLAALAAGTWYFGRQPERTAGADRQADGEPPSYYMKEAVVLRTDETGRVRYRIHADLARERPGAEALSLDGVRIEWEGEGIPWQVHAGRAVAWLEEQALQLEGGVELVRAPDENGNPAIVRTEQLLLEPLRHLASANGEVTFMLGPNQLVAEGLKAFLKEDRLELESNVHGRFQP